MPVTEISSSCFSIGSNVRLTFPSNADVELAEGGEHGWRSLTFGHMFEAPVIRAAYQERMPASAAAMLDVSAERSPAHLDVEISGGLITLHFQTSRHGTIHWPAQGPPQIV